MTRRLDMWVLLAAVLAAGCDVPRGPRKPAFPRFEATGFLESGQTSAARSGESAEPIVSGDNDEAPAPAPIPDDASPVGISNTGPALLPIADDLIGIMQPVDGRAWSWQLKGDTYSLIHTGSSGIADATITSAPIPTLLGGWPGVEHVARWLLIRGASSDLVSLMRGWWATAGAGWRAWLPGTPGSANADLLAAGLLATDHWSTVGDVIVQSDSFSGWRWTGRNDSGLHLRFGVFDGTMHAAQGMDWPRTQVNETAKAIEQWAARLPSTAPSAERTLRRLRLVSSKTDKTCLINAECDLELATAATAAADDGGPPVAAIYNEKGDLVATAAEGTLLASGSGWSWHWGSAPAGKYLVRWHKGNDPAPVDPFKDGHLILKVGETNAVAATVGLGYVDHGENRVRGRFLVIACKSPCNAGDAIRHYLSELRAPTEAESALLRSRTPAEPAGANLTPQVSGTDFIGDLAKAMAAISQFKAGKERVKAMDDWWRTGTLPSAGAGLPGPPTPTEKNP